MAHWTPWGYANRQRTIAPGMVWFTTDRHGGVRLSERLWNTMPEELRGVAGEVGGESYREPDSMQLFRWHWYEEHRDIGVVQIAFPALWAAWYEAQQRHYEEMATFYEQQPADALCFSPNGRQWDIDACRHAAVHAEELRSHFMANATAMVEDAVDSAQDDLGRLDEYIQRTGWDDDNKESFERLTDKFYRWARARAWMYTWLNEQDTAFFDTYCLDETRIADCAAKWGKRTPIDPA